MICQICGKEFTPKNNVQIYCNHWCCKEAEKRRNRERYYELKKDPKAKPKPKPKDTGICKQCGKIFVKETSRHEFCCVKCFDVWRYRHDRVEYMRQYQKKYREKLKEEKEKGIVREVKHHYKPEKKSKLQQKLAEIRKAGYGSYAEYQMAMSKQKMKAVSE